VPSSQHFRFTPTNRRRSGHRWPTRLLIVRIKSVEENPACLLNYLLSHDHMRLKFWKLSFEQIGFVPVVLTDALDKQKLTFRG
jgi:hypothetical protein